MKIRDKLVPAALALATLMVVVASVWLFLPGTSSNAPIALMGIGILLAIGGVALLLRRYGRSLAKIQRAADRAATAATSGTDRIIARVDTRSSFAVEATRHVVARDVGALLSLHDLVKVKGAPLSHTSWVATPETIVALVALATDLPDGAVIFEAGGGLSTMWMALAVAQSGRDVKIVSLDHQTQYAESTQAALERQRITKGVEVRFAPLKSMESTAGELQWYDPTGWSDVKRIDLMFVDGPPGGTSVAARFPAFRLLEEALVDGAIIVLDDTDREEERTILERWIAESTLGTLTIERELDRATMLRFRRTA
jgi:predicted O-methyltransferase YrrM